MHPITRALRLLPILLPVLLPVLRAAGAPGSAPARTAGAVTRDVPASAVAPQRLERISRRYLGVPYKLDCLGEGKGPDPDPLFTRKYADCQTLVEQVMAEALAPYVGGLNAAIPLIRYRGGDVALEHRYHYCLPDWLEHPWPARDVTEQVGGAHVRRTTRTIDRAALLHARGVTSAAANMPVETVRTGFIPREEIPAVLSRIPDGSIIMFVLGRPDIVCGHLGFVFLRHGEPVLRDASQTRHRVIDEPLTAYLARAPRRFIGIKLLQPDVAGLSRR